MAMWLGTAQALPENPALENTWNANLFKIERKNWLICVHTPTAYSIVFPEIKKADTKQFELWFYPRLSEQLHRDGIEPELISAYPSSPLVFFKTNNHSRTIGIMTTHVGDLKYMIPRRGGTQNVGLLEINHTINRVPMGPHPYTWPIGSMREFLGGESRA